jgi:hypothetical protein
MPFDFQNHPSAGGRQIHETLCHELGHNLGMGDLYTPAVPDRNMGSWEPMAFELGLPSLSLYHLMRQGWATNTWVKPYNFISMAAPVDEVITLHPVEAGSPPAGRFSGIEIRIADGWNYYFEYKKGIVGEINSQSLPQNRRVLGTDGVSGSFVPPFERPTVMLLAKDADGDGQVIAAGQDYKETDISDPTFPTDFKVSVVSEDGDKAQVRVQYGVNSRPDPSIRPWPASADRQWQSPDIEVKNARSITNPLWFNTPWLNNDNTIVAKIKNSGGLDAPTVKANFYIKNYNIGGAPEVFLGSDTKNIPAGATVEFTTNWRPPVDGHFCVIVRIPLYQVPGTAVVEMTELNNMAQSNYDRFLSGSASPYSREIRYLEVGNPFPDRDARVFVIPSQDNLHYRTYLEHTWVYLKPSETRKIKMMVERMDYSDLPFDYKPYAGLKINELSTTGIMVKNPVAKVSVMALINEGVSDGQLPHQNLIPLGGIDATIASGKKTEFAFVQLEGQTVYGRVVLKGTQIGVVGGSILVKYFLKTLNSDGTQVYKYQKVKMQADGYFRDKLKTKSYQKIQCYYDPAPELVDCWSNEVFAPSVIKVKTPIAVGNLIK